MEEQILFTWAVQGFWWRETDISEAIWLGGVENARRFGLGERDLDNALRNAGTWMNVNETERIDA